MFISDHEDFTAPLLVIASVPKDDWLYIRTYEVWNSALQCHCPNWRDKRKRNCNKKVCCVRERINTPSSTFVGKAAQRIQSNSAFNQLSWSGGLFSFQMMGALADPAVPRYNSQHYRSFKQDQMHDIPFELSDCKYHNIILCMYKFEICYIQSHAIIEQAIQMALLKSCIYKLSPHSLRRPSSIPQGHLLMNSIMCQPAEENTLISNSQCTG